MQEAKEDAHLEERRLEREKEKNYRVKLVGLLYSNDLQVKLIKPPQRMATRDVSGNLLYSDTES